MENMFIHFGNSSLHRWKLSTQKLRTEPELGLWAELILLSRKQWDIWAETYMWELLTRQFWKPEALLYKLAKT